MIEQNREIKNRCCLCSAVNDSISKGINSALENRLLLETKNFVVIPSLGPFVEGQIMIVSKKHYSNLQSMNIDTHKELELIFNKIKSKTNLIYKTDLIFAEHGAFNDIQKGGACVIHMHIHCIPGYNDGVEALKSQLKVIYSGSDIKELFNIKKPYILVIDSRDSINYIFEAENVPSQMIRKTLLANRGISTNWNWRTNYEYEMISNTINKWNSI